MNKQNKTKYRIILLLFCILLSNCSNGNYRYYQNKLYNYYEEGELEKAEKLVKKNKFLPEENNFLLKTIEKGTAYYYNGKYCNAIQEFNIAGNILQQQQTKSISSAISSTIGLNEGIFYGETFEKSLVNFYKSVTNYQIYNQGYCEKLENNEYIIVTEEKPTNDYKNNENKTISTETNKDNIKNENNITYLTNNEKQNYLKAARSNILYWDSWIKSRIVTEEDKFYIEDVLLKIWGAFVHEQIGGNFELQIAKQLYQDAKNIITNRYQVYKTFNNKNQSFINHLTDKYKRDKFKENNNIYLNDILKYCDDQINRIKNKIKSNMLIVIHDGNVSLKKVKKKQIGTKTLLISASKDILGILSLLSLTKTEYEVPYINEEINKYRYFYEFSQNNKIIKKQPIILSEPISDINYMNLQEKVNGITERLLLGLTAKYIAVLAPIATAYFIAINSNDPIIQLLAIGTAIASYASSAYLIEQSSLVDIRQWVSLPANIFIATDNIKEGKYQFKILKILNNLNSSVSNGIVNAKQEKIVYQKDIEIEKDKTTFINLKIL